MIAIGFMYHLNRATQRPISRLKHTGVLLHRHGSVLVADHVNDWDMGLGQRLQVVDGLEWIVEGGLLVRESVRANQRLPVAIASGTATPAIGPGGEIANRRV